LGRLSAGFKELAAPAVSDRVAEDPLAGRFGVPPCPAKPDKAETLSLVLRGLNRGRLAAERRDIEL